MAEQQNNADARRSSATVTSLAPAERRQALRIVEAIIFASAAPVAVERLRQALAADSDVEALLRELQQAYAGRGVHLVQVAGGWAFRTAPDLAVLLRPETEEPARPSRAAMETLAVIAYHQPVTRAEIEQLRGVSLSRGTLDFLLDAGWVRMRGRRLAPGRPLTYGTTDGFLDHFGLDGLSDLPGGDDLRGAGLIADPDLVLPPKGPPDPAAEEEPLD